LAIAGPLIAPHGALESDFVHGVSPMRTPVGPSRLFWLGADRMYRDQFARLAAGAGFSLVTAVSATALATVLGALVGLTAGWFEGPEGVRTPWTVLLGAFGAIACAVTGHPRLAWVAVTLGLLGAIGAATSEGWLRMGPRTNIDALLMGVVDVVLAFPFILLVMALAAAAERTTPATVVVVLGLSGWLRIARVVRTKTMQIRALDFILAARALGRSTAGILLRHVLPNVAGLLLSVATVSIAQMILAESVLGYLGVGVPPPQPTWGRMLVDGQDLLLSAPWMVAAPASAIVVAMLGFHLLGEGLREAFDPRA
jgi:ABC-type dipeptide/oligopeptide/nickel transport system permease subunit